MKKIAKITAVFAALVLALAFVACSEEDEPSVVSEWVATYKGEEITMIFYDDGTATMKDGSESSSGPYTSTLGTTTVGSVITFIDETDSESVTIYKNSAGKLYFYLDGLYFYKK